ncbi:MAG: AAA family ATPase [Pirellulaceae bacterium]|nr:AAA family ATPase [Pirellulaceae bacterium]
MMPEHHDPRNTPASDIIRTTTDAVSLAKPVSFVELAKQHTELRQPVVHGLLRLGEVANVIAAPKVGKSFLAGNLAWCIATGRPWLSHDVEPGRVLVIDNELHAETLASLLDQIADAMKIDHSQRGLLDVISLRGRAMSVETLTLLDVPPDRYRLVVLDALYRTLPPGTSENDNSAMMSVYNHLDAIAAKWQAAIVVVNHSSKGQQGDKFITDVGAGAGAISRAADTHLVIRPHEDSEQCVLEAVCRSWQSPEPVSIRFNWPLWSATTAEPLVKKQTRRNTEEQSKQDQVYCDHLLSIIPERGIVQNSLITKSGFGQNRCMRLLGILSRNKQVSSQRKRWRGGKQKFVVWTKALPESHTESIPNHF